MKNIVLSLVLSLIFVSSSNAGFLKLPDEIFTLSNDIFTIGPLSPSRPTVVVDLTNSRVRIGNGGNLEDSAGSLYVWGSEIFSGTDLVARFRGDEVVAGSSVWIEGSTGKYAELRFNLGNTVKKASIRYEGESLQIFINSGTLKAIDINDDATVTFTGAIQLSKKTAVQLRTIIPKDVGEIYFNINVNKVFSSTGTNVGAFAASDDYLVGP